MISIEKSFIDEWRNIDFAGLEVSLMGGGHDAGNERKDEAMKLKW